MGDKASEREISGAISARVNFLQQHQSSRRFRHVAYARLYGNANMYGVAGDMGRAMALAEQSGPKERVTHGVTQSIIDTVVAQVGENKPRPYFLTSGGTYKEQRRAKRLNQFTEGIFYENRGYELGGDAQRDAEVFGDGLIHIWDRKGRVCWERVLAGELWVDEAEGMYGKPRELHWVRPVDREMLLAAFPDAREVILSSEAEPIANYIPVASQADMVMVRESWHLRSGEDADDGKHTISIAGGLLDPILPWEHDFFPFARFTSMTRPMGYWGQGAAERLQSKHIEINKLLWLIQRSMHMAGTFKVFIQAGSKIVKEHINNEIGAIIEWKGSEPKFFVPNVVPMEYYSHFQTLVRACYEQEGVSLQVSTGEKPAGLNSGEAQRVYRDTVALRMKTRERLNERAFMDAAEVSIAIARDIALRDGKYTVSHPNKRALDEVSMSADELDPSGWDVKCFPTSSLPKDPAGRLQTIQEYIQAGFMTPRQGRRALDFPDLEAVESLANASEDLLTKLLDAICDDGEYTPPEPTDDLQLGKELVIEYINRGRALDLEPERLDLLRNWSAQVDALQAAATPPMPAAMPGQDASPQAQPAAPPTSNLLPFAA